MNNVNLDAKEVRLLLQSLDHCLATCTNKPAGGKTGPCEDCQAARALREKLAALKPVTETKS